MRITENAIDGLNRNLSIAIAAAEIDAMIAEKLETLRTSANIRGFRRGRVPLVHIKRLYGTNVAGEVIQQSIATALEKTLKDRSEKPAFQPKITLDDEDDLPKRILAGGNDLAFSTIYEILPAIVQTDLASLVLEKSVAEVEPIHIERALERIASDHRDYPAKLPADGDPKHAPVLTEIDAALVDVSCAVDGKRLFAEDKADLLIPLDSPRFPQNFVKALNGAASGESVSVEVNYPDHDPNPARAGKTAIYTLAVKEVRSAVTPAIDDDFAARLGFDNRAELVAEVEKSVAGEYETAAQAALKKNLLDQLDQMHQFDLPPTLVNEQFNMIWGLISNSVTDEDTDQDIISELRRDYRTIAERRVRLELVLRDIGETHNLQVNRNDVQNQIMQRVQAEPQRSEEIMSFYRSPENQMSLSREIYESKVVDFMLEFATVKTVTVSARELLDLPEDLPTADDAEEAETKTTETKKPRQRKSDAKAKPAKKAKAAVSEKDEEKDENEPPAKKKDKKAPAAKTTKSRTKSAPRKGQPDA